MKAFGFPMSRACAPALIVGLVSCSVAEPVPDPELATAAEHAPAEAVTMSAEPDTPEPPPAATPAAEAPASDASSTPETTTSASPWFDPTYAPPTRLVTERMLLEPLAGEHVDLDFAALMGSREHLQRTLHWGDWPPPDFTVAENLGDLQRHWQEFEDREGYAFTVLTPDRSRCIGCIYLEPAGPRDPPTRDAMLAYWVVEDQLESELDRHLLAEVLAWIETEWTLERVVLPSHVDNDRGAALADQQGLTRLPADGGVHVLHVWQR